MEAFTSDNQDVYSSVGSGETKIDNLDTMPLYDPTPGNTPDSTLVPKVEIPRIEVKVSRIPIEEPMLREDYDSLFYERVCIVICTFLTYGTLLTLAVLHLLDSKDAIKYWLVVYCISVSISTPFICVMIWYISKQLRRLDIHWFDGFTGV